MTLRNIFFIIFISTIFSAKFLFCTQDLNPTKPVKLNKLILSPDKRSKSEFDFIEFLSNLEKALVGTVLSNFPFIPNDEISINTVNHSKEVISKRAAQNLLFLFEEWNLFLPQKLEYWTLALIPDPYNNLSSFGLVEEIKGNKINFISNNSDGIKAFSKNIEALQIEKKDSKAPAILSNLLNIGVKHGEIVVKSQTLIRINSFETEFSEENEKVSFEKVRVDSSQNSPLTGILEFKITIMENKSIFENPTVTFGPFEKIIPSDEGFKFSFKKDKTINNLLIVGNNIKSTPTLVGRLKGNSFKIKPMGKLNKIFEKLTEGRSVRFNIPSFTIDKDTLLIDKIDIPVSINVFKDLFIGSIRLGSVNSEFQKELNFKIERIYQSIFSNMKELLALYEIHDPKAIVKMCDQLFINWGK